MEEIKINKEWYEGLIKIIGNLEKFQNRYNNEKLMIGEIAHLKGYAESLQTQFGNEQLQKS